jgi:hypothetical protein
VLRNLLKRLEFWTTAAGMSLARFGGKGSVREEAAMSAPYLSLAVVLSLAVPSFAQSRRDGAAAGARHHARGMSSSPSRQGPPTAVARPGAPSRGVTGPESRHPRAGTGTGSRYYHGGYYRPYYPYYPYYYPYGYWGYAGYPYFGFGYYGGGYYGGGYYGGGYYDHHDGSVRVLVDPAETRVFVDGAYAGTADEFDGLFQRLHVQPGRHEIALKLEGYRTHRMRVYVPEHGTLKLHHDMVEGSGEDPLEDLAGDRYAEGDRYADDGADARARDEQRRRDVDLAIERGEAREPYYRSGAPTDAAWLVLAVRPEGASIYVDGQFRGTARSLGRLELAAGPHRIEILHPGLRTFERDIELEAGESETLEVELSR